MKDRKSAGSTPDEKDPVDHLELQPTTTSLTTTTSRSIRVRNHLIRFWIWYTVASVIFLAIFLPILCGQIPL